MEVSRPLYLQAEPPGEKYPRVYLRAAKARVPASFVVAGGSANRGSGPLRRPGPKRCTGRRPMGKTL